MQGNYCKFCVSNASNSKVWKIFVQHDVVITARQLATVLTQIVWMTVDNKVHHQTKLNIGVMITKTRVASEAFAVPVVNLTSKAYVVKQGDLIGTATPADEYHKIMPPELLQGRSDFPADTIDHLQSPIDGFTPSLTTEKKAKPETSIGSYADLFSKSKFDSDQTDLMTHTIDIGDKKPFKHQLRKHPWAHQEVIDKHVNKMLASGIISPTISSRVTNVILVKKASGKL